MADLKPVILLDKSDRSMILYFTTMTIVFSISLVVG